MAGKTTKESKEYFKPDSEIDINRTWAKKKADWRMAEGLVLGKQFVQAKERELKARERQQQIIKKNINV